MPRAGDDWKAITSAGSPLCHLTAGHWASDQDDDEYNEPTTRRPTTTRTKTTTMASTTRTATTATMATGTTTCTARESERERERAMEWPPTTCQDDGRDKYEDQNDGESWRTATTTRRRRRRRVMLVVILR